MIQPWPVLRSQTLTNYRIFRVRQDFKVSPRTGTEHDFYVTDCPDWVNVIATTPEGHLVMVEQFRHGTNSIDMEIPGGVMDPHETDPVAAGLRELREETGFTGERARVLSRTRPNPAFMSNTCHTILVENCRHTHEVELDLAEDVRTYVKPWEEVACLLNNGAIPHSLVTLALHEYQAFRRRTGAGC